MAQPNISGYTIIRLLGAGGFASVYLAEDDVTGHEVAIKVLHDHTSKPDDLRRFERERTSMRALSGHPNIVAIHDSGQTDLGQHYTVLEFVEGGSVRDKITEGGALHWASVVEIGVQICAALDVAHRNGVLHRDVKPANILLDGDVAKLSDFGIARLVGQSQVTAAQSIIGTLAYTPPEVFHNKPFDGRGDIYQLGVSLYEMLLGRAPFTSAAADNKATIIRRILDHPAPPLAQFDIPDPLSDLLDEVLAKDPADRPQSAESFGRRLNDVEVRMGRAPTIVDVDSDEFIAGVANANTATVAISKDTEAIVPSSIWPDASHAVPDAERETQSILSVTPEPPAVEPPFPADITVAEPLPMHATSVIRQPAPTQQKPERAAVPIVDDRPAIPPATATAMTPAGASPEKRRRWPWFLAVVLLLGAAGASIAIWQLSDPTGSSDDPGGDGGVVQPPEANLEFVPVDDPAFTAPGGSDGVVFSSVANSQGLTMVGGAGSGEEVAQQRSVVWTLGAIEDELTIRMRSDFAEAEGLSAASQRLWDIAVIDREQLLAVGEKQGGGGTNGIAWIGSQASVLRPANDASFQGAARESLRGATGDLARNEFIVVGNRGQGNNLVMGLWTLAEGDGWATPTWTAIDVGTGEDGVLNDVAVREDIAVAVGAEMVGTANAGVVLIRRGDTWSNLITPIPNATFHSVTIADGRVVAVGQKNTGVTSVPFAVVTTNTGEGFQHNLPIRGASGTARSVGVVSGGRVIAVGDVDGDFDRDGAIWELLPADALGADRWTTRATPDLQQDGFVELWAIDEFEDVVYVFGRTESDESKPAGAWTLTLADAETG